MQSFAETLRAELKLGGDYFYEEKGAIACGRLAESLFHAP